MPLNRIREFLDRHDVRYTVISHSVAYTAQGIAALAHIPGKELAKTVIVNIDGRFAMAGVPASMQVDLSLLKEAAGASSIDLPSELEFKSSFPDCEAGSMPPFGNLYNMTVYADESLAGNKVIAFNAGSHRELVRLVFEDFLRLVTPKLVPLGTGHSSRAA